MITTIPHHRLVRGQQRIPDTNSRCLSRCELSGHAQVRKGLHHHDMESKAASAKNFDEKIYMFPESFNALRSELVTNWPNLWALVGWPMAFSAGLFIERMNEALDLTVQLDSGKVDAICTEYLQALWKKRGFKSN